MTHNNECLKSRLEEVREQSRQLKDKHYQINSLYLKHLHKTPTHLWLGYSGRMTEWEKENQSFCQKLAELDSDIRHLRQLEEHLQDGIGGVCFSSPAS